MERPKIQAHPVVSIMDWITETPETPGCETRMCRDCGSLFQALPASERRSCIRCVKRTRKAAGYA